jgi:hypothetical protein
MGVVVGQECVNVESEDPRQHNIWVYISYICNVFSQPSAKPLDPSTIGPDGVECSSLGIVPELNKERSEIMSASGNGAAFVSQALHEDVVDRMHTKSIGFGHTILGKGSLLIPKFSTMLCGRGFS